jgi:hypothetical protein
MKILAALIAMGTCAVVHAHHSRIQYDTTTIVEMSGEIIAVKWRNPHVMYTMHVTNANGDVEPWMLEAGSIYMLARTGITRNRVEIGDTVRVAGYASGRGDPEFYLTNVLLPDGQEVVMLPTAKPYWSDDALGGRDQWNTAPAEATTVSNGIFRVWSIESSFGRRSGTDRDNLPLTGSAHHARNSFDPLTDDPNLNCIEPGMPRTMVGPHPLLFIDRGNEIEVRIAEYDIVRTIHLISDTNAELEDPKPSKQGYSRGTWSGNVLEVSTDHVNWPFYDGTGTPLSTAVEMQERFTLSEDNKRLDYHVTVNDPATFTEPVITKLYWVDIREPMETYNCVPSY